MANGIQKLLGGPPVVGAFLALLGLTPPALFRGIRDLINHTVNLGFDAVETVFRYFIYGAVIVIPIWLFTRLFRG